MSAPGEEAVLIPLFAVIAIDNDSTRLRLARHNALHHGVADRIEFVLADFVDFARSRAARRGNEAIDVVFLSPPWGECDVFSSFAMTADVSPLSVR